MSKQLKDFTLSVNKAIYTPNKVSFSKRMKLAIKARLLGCKNKYSLSAPNVVPPLDEKRVASLKGKRIAIYTCVTGGYDDIKEPIFVNDNVDYFIYTDSKQEFNVWKKKDLPAETSDMSLAMKNRYIKLHPTKLFPDYDYIIYIDGSTVISGDIIPLLSLVNDEIGLATHKHALRDCIYEEKKACFLANKGNKKAIKAQMKRYKSEGYPKNNGLCECTLLFIKNNESATKIFDAWWDELIKTNAGRDQLCLPYVLWSLKIDVKDVTTLGNNLLMSDSFVVFPHK